MMNTAPAKIQIQGILARNKPIIPKTPTVNAVHFAKRTNFPISKQITAKITINNENKAKSVHEPNNELVKELRNPNDKKVVPKIRRNITCKNAIIYPTDTTNNNPSRCENFFIV